MLDLIAIQYTVGILSAIGGFFVALPPVRKLFVKFWVKTLGRNGAKIDTILSELRPNGGDSLRDSVNRIENRQSGFDAFLTAQLNVQDKAIFRTNAEGKVIYNNRKHQRLTGFSYSEIEGDGWINVIHPDDRELVYSKWCHAVEDKREFSEDIRYVYPDGEIYLVHVNAYREMEPDGTIRGYLGVVIPLDDDPLPCPHVERCRVDETNRR